MSEPVRYESIQEPLDDEERELMDPDNWDWDNPVEVFVHPDSGSMFPVRFTGDEVGRLEPVARAEGLSPHEFIKQAALAWLPLDDEERELMDPETWDWESTEEGLPNPNAGAVLRVRFARDEFLALAQTARDEGIGPVELIRQTTLGRIATDTLTQDSAATA